MPQLILHKCRSGLRLGSSRTYQYAVEVFSSGHDSCVLFPIVGHKYSVHARSSPADSVFAFLGYLRIAPITAKRARSVE